VYDYWERAVNSTHKVASNWAIQYCCQSARSHSFVPCILCLLFSFWLH